MNYHYPGNGLEKSTTSFDKVLPNGILILANKLKKNITFGKRIKNSDKL